MKLYWAKVASGWYISAVVDDLLGTLFFKNY